MGLIERIKAEKDRQSKEDANRGPFDLFDNLAKDAEKRARFIAKKTGKIVKECSLVNTLIRLDKEIVEGNAPYHQYYYLPEQGKAGLIWGNTPFAVTEDGGVDGEGSFSGILATVDADMETLTIEGFTQRTLRKGEWNNRKLFEYAISEAFLKPATLKRFTPSSTNFDPDNFDL
jgi:hypothetical protein